MDRRSFLAGLMASVALPAVPLAAKYAGRMNFPFSALPTMPLTFHGDELTWEFAQQSNPSIWRVSWDDADGLVADVIAPEDFYIDGAQA